MPWQEVPAPFEIVQQDEQRVASNGAQTMVLKAPADDGRLFRRRGIKRAGTPEAANVEWSVAELDGVRVYFDGQAVIVTREDLWP